MSRFVLAIILMFGSGHAQAQSYSKTWTRTTGSNSYDFGYAVAADAFGNAIIAGGTQGSITGGNAGRYDLFVAKHDAAGNRLWVIQRGTAEREFAYGAATDSAGNVYVTGHTGAGLDGNSRIGLWDAYLMKLSPTGAWQWTRQVGTGQDDEGRAVATDASGNVYVTGYVRGNLHGITRVGSADAFISKYSSAGTRLWSALFGSADVDESFGIACDAAGNVFVTGWCSGSIEGNPYLANGDNFLVKYDTNGNRQWLRQWGTWNKDTGYALACDAVGNVYLSGYTTGALYGSAQGNRDMFLAKFDADGNLLWGRETGTSGHDQAWGVTTDAAGNAYVAGETGGQLGSDPHQGGLDVFVSKYDPAGNNLWIKQIGTGAEDWADGAAMGPGGVLFLGGTTTGSLDGNANLGLNDSFVMKFTLVPDPPTVAAASPVRLCTGGSSQLSANPSGGGNTVEWFVGSCGGTAVPGGVSPTVSPGGTTTYYARTKDTAGGAVSTCVTVTVTVGVCVPPDLDGDVDVDAEDFKLFADCMSGPAIPSAPGCDNGDFDDDGDVDQSDFGVFQCCYGGENRVPDPACAN